MALSLTARLRKVTRAISPVNPKFAFSKFGAVKALQYLPWQKSGVSHAFLGQGIEDASSRVCELESSHSICLAFGVSKLRLHRQVHGKRIVGFNQIGTKCGAFDADGWLVNLQSKHSTAYAVLTADCCPVILRCGSHSALLHAGWRGLAGGILENALGMIERLVVLDEHLPRCLEVVVGPCAGPCCYEVGVDVLDQFEESGVFNSVNDRYMLNLPHTLERIIRESCSSEVLFSWCELCTICGTGWHSYRRDREASGRNLSLRIS